MKKTLLLFILACLVWQFSEAQSLTPQQGKKGKWGFVNTNGKFQIKAKYESAENFSEGLACVKENGLFGYIDESGELRIPAVYQNASSFKDGYAVCCKDGKYGMIKPDGKQALAFDFSEISLSKNGQFYVGKKKGEESIFVISIKPKVTGYKYDEMTYLPDDKIFLVKSSGKVGYVAENGSLLASPKFNNALTFNTNGIAIAETKEGKGLVNNKLEHLTALTFPFVKEVKNDYFLYGTSDHSFGIVDKKGKICIKNGAYQNTEYYETYSVVLAKTNDGYELVNMDGNSVVPKSENITVSDGIATFKNGSVCQKLNLSTQKLGLVVNGKEIWTSEAAQSIQYEKPFVVWTDIKGKKRLMTENGKPVFEEYDEVYPIMGKFFIVKKGDKQAVTDASGKVLCEWLDAVIPIDSHYTQLVKVTGRNRETACAIMSESGKVITGFDFTWVNEKDKEGLIPVKLIRRDNLGRTDKKLKIVGDQIYVVGDKSEGFYAITDINTKKMGVLNEKGKIIVTPKYDEVGDFHNGMCRVWILGKGNGFINTSGTLVVPCKYQRVYDFGSIEGMKNYTVVYDNLGYAHYIDKKGAYVNEDKVAREVYNNQRQNSWY